MKLRFPIFYNWALILGFNIMRCLALGCENNVRLPFCANHWLNLPEDKKAKLTQLYRAKGINSQEYQDFVTMLVKHYFSNSSDTDEMIDKRVKEYIRLDSNKKLIEAKRMRLNYYRRLRK